MADNVEAASGSGGPTFASDDIGGIQFPRVKLVHGGDGTNAGDVSTSNGLPVNVLNTSLTVALSATDNAVLDSIDTAVNGTLVVDGSGVTQPVSGSVGIIGNVSIQDNGNSITVDGTVTANLSATDNAVLDSIDTAATALATTVSGTELQVDVVGSLPAGTNAIGKLSANSGVDIGDVDVTSISAGSNLIGDVGLSGARTSGGTTPYRNIDVDETEDEIKATAGQLYFLHVMNLTAAVVYVQVYNATAANVTVGTTTPTMTFAVATHGDTNGAGFVLSVPNGIAFDTAITIACTTTVGGSSGPATNGVIVNAGYA